MRGEKVRRSRFAKEKEIKLEDVEASHTVGRVGEAGVLLSREVEGSRCFLEDLVPVSHKLTLFHVFPFPPLTVVFYILKIEDFEAAHTLCGASCIRFRLGLLVDSDIDVSTRNGNTRVFINSRYLKVIKSGAHEQDRYQ